MKECLEISGLKMLEGLVELINTKVEGANATLLIPGEDHTGDSSILVDSQKIVEVCSLLKNNEVCSLKVLQVISGVDYTDYIEVCYMLCNFDPKNLQDVILKVRLTDRENPKLKTITDLWLSANWQERECYDMLGVEFEGHPDHRRILCPDDWEGFPLRKDYVVQEVYRGMKVNPEDKMNTYDREFLTRQKDMEQELMDRSLEKGL
jgi:NADH-quinone oxidoreductase subunit C